MPSSAVGAGTYSSTSFDPESPVEDYHHSAFDPLIGRKYSAMPTEPVFPLIQRVRHEVAGVIDTVLAYEQLKSPTINFSIVRPLSIKLSKGPRPPSALIYALLVNRIHFLSEADSDLAFLGVNTTRADLCELLAVKLLSAYETAPTSLELLHVLTADFSPFNGITKEMLSEEEDIEDLQAWGQDQRANALELAVFSKAKRFVKSPLVMQVVGAIYDGTITYTPSSGTHSLLNDDYKTRPVVQVYDWKQQPFLDHYRLRVPAIRNRLEFLTFTTIMVLFLLTQTSRSADHVTLWEVLFVLWSLGFALDELASIQENGISAYFLSVYNALDFTFLLVFFAYLGLRIQGLTASGFLCALWVLAKPGGVWHIGNISWLMFKIWLGNSFLGFEAAQQFHPFYGPLLIVMFAILSQTLLLTILISLLSNTFAAVQANAETELLNQKALRTIERVKSDALTSYAPPLNLAAFAILFVAKPFVTPRKFHSLNVLLIKTFNLPVLVFLALHTRLRYRKASGTAAKITLETARALASLPRGIAWDGTVDGLGKVFEYDVTEAGLKVESIDKSDDEEDEEDTSPTRTRSIDAQAKLKTVASGARQTKLPGVSSHARMGSLASPLAKMFTVPDVNDGLRSASPGRPVRAKEVKDKEEKQRDGGGLEPGVVARLEAIEAALAILVGEVTRSKDEGEVERPPLTSLTGEAEASYKD
ncbi:receptor-activated ca2+-permeable cation channel [Pseudohyphozyma bogoriensis]|nr:receptor-activated ca2+-permeable cation channel [Pseudohyphozyma bogoriensis]